MAGMADEVANAKRALRAELRERRRITSGSQRERADDALILEEGEAPSTGKGVGLLAAGLVLGGILVASSGRKQAVAKGESPPPLPPH